MPEPLDTFSNGYTESIIEVERSASLQYGKALIFYTNMDPVRGLSHEHAAVMLQAPVSNMLRAHKCPNIFNEEVLSPSDCEVAGSFHGSKIYSIHNSLPSAVSDYFVELDGTFVGYRNFSDGTKPNFKVVELTDVDARLSANRQRVEKLNDAYQKQQDADEKAKKVAYLHLPFKPVEPDAVPEGWERYLTQIYGANPANPDGIELYYQHKVGDSHQVVFLYVASRNAFTYQNAECGPGRAWGKPSVPCTQIAEDTYMGIESSNTYIFKLVRDKLIIGVAFEPHSEPVGLPLETALRQIMSGFRQVPADAYKSAGYDGF